jgi:hypothetical protein
MEVALVQDGQKRRKPGRKSKKVTAATGMSDTDTPEAGVTAP